MRRSKRVLAVALAFGLLAAACGDDDEEVGSSGEGEAAEDGGEAAAGSCAVEDLELTEAGVLTVATGEEVYEPWMANNDPASGEGFESALVYALAAELGFAEDAVRWEQTGFDEAIAPGDKDYDFNIQQYSITADRDEVVDFSDGYYEVEQALVAAADSEIASAASLADLKSARLGAAIGTTSLDYIDEVIQPETESLVFDDNAAAKAAFDAGQVDGIVFDLPTAYYITSVEIPDSSIVGVLPVVGETEELGMLFEDGSPLVPCVNQALAALQDAGTLDALQEEWLNQGGSIPTLSE